MALELVGGALLSASLNFLLERIGSPMILSYLRRKSKHSDFDDLLSKLKIRFNSVSAVLDDAEHKQITRNWAVESWLDDLQEAVFDAEDLFDEIEYDVLQLKLEGEFKPSSSKVRKYKKKLGNLFSRSHDSNDGDMEKRMRKILERLEYLVKQKDVLGLKERVGERPSWRLPSTCLVDVSEVYGRDDDKDVILKLLMLNDVGGERICVIPIVGMGGVGKTTLAQAVFNDDEVQKNFELKAWVCVSEDFDVCKVTKTLLESDSSDGAMDLNSLQLKLKERLMRKKFLIVLDDVWNESYVDLEAMMMPFRYGAQGSKIIVTTRSRKVASIMGTVPSHILGELTEEASWQLFAKHASGINGDFTAHPDLERIGKEIVMKCKGLPLAVKTLGGLLRSTEDVREWERIAKSDIWELADEQSKILPALRLSYYYLPPHLKRCFAFCSVFPKDYRFEKEELVLLWMAEGLLEHPARNKRTEEVGDEYFTDLVSRSFFQVSYGDYIIHDLLVDLAKFVSRKCFIFLETNSRLDEMEMNQARHLSYYSAWPDPNDRLNSIIEAPRLRTFLPIQWFGRRGVLPEEVIGDLCLKFRCLRVLSFSFYKNIKQLPDSIGELRHLRYLDLSFTSISRLPESVSKLYNLQTLKLRNCQSITKLPKDMHRLTNLRYLNANGSGLEELPESICMLQNLQTLKLAYCRSLTKLPNDFHKLISLRHLDANSSGLEELPESICILQNLQTLNLSSCQSLTKLPNDFHKLPNLRYLYFNGSGLVGMPTRLGRMKSLETLSTFIVGTDNGTMIGELGGLSNLRGTFRITNLQNVVKAEDALEANMKEKKYLEELKLEWEDETKSSNREMDVLGNLWPNSTLKGLKIKNYGDTEFPNWLGDPSFCNLVNVRLQKCKHCDHLPPLGQLQSLKVLEIVEFDAVVKVGQELFGNESSIGKPFASLEVLRFYNMSNWEEWSMVAEDTEAFPKLRRLSLSDCNKLAADLPHFLPSLKELSVRKCPQLSSSLPEMPVVSELTLDDCDKLPGGYHVLESFECLQHLEISKYLDSTTCRSLPASLETLEISGCKNLEIPLLHSYHCPNLTALHISNCESLITSGRSWNLQGLPNLTKFTILGYGCENNIESFPTEGLLPGTITELHIYGLGRLKTLDNNGLQQLTSLTSLIIFNCPNLQTIPEEGFPHSLEYLNISGCPLLEKKCEREGEYWNKISRVPKIVINYESVN